MATGKQVFEQALMMLNYTDSTGRPNGQKNKALYARALSLLNQICCDLYYVEGRRDWKPLNSMDDPLPLSDRAVSDVLPYGLAMLLAQSESDIDNQTVYSTLFNQKRLSLSSCRRRVDTLPRPIF